MVIIATDSDFPEQRYWPDLLKRQVEEAKQQVAQAKAKKKTQEEANQTQQPVEPEPIAEQSVSQSKEQMHYVLSTEVSGRAMEEARKFIPDAFVREFPEGPRIQMGVFKNPDTAKNLVEQLQQQGINASIYSP
ncbi:MAG: SPOR domain-containing protein [Merismopedia sp. SIO2A8]|nr:SPOR domain-containing protein [Merismopedia sp. SIO2A8]